jgi:hypothetical protein
MWMLAQSAPDPFERRLHAQPGIGAHHQKVHEIRKAHAVLVAAARNAPVDIHARPDIADDAGHHHRQPEHRGRERNQHRQHDERGNAQPDRKRSPGDKEISDCARIENAGPNQAAAQHLHVVLVLVGGGIVRIGCARETITVERRRLRSRIAMRGAYFNAA